MCSFIGDGIATVALVLLVQEREGTGVAVGALLLAGTLPRLLGPLAGALADRLPTRRLMVACDLGQAAVYASIAALDPGFGVLLGLVVAATVLATIFAPANSAALPRLVRPDELLTANAQFNSAFNLQLALGPLLGGLLVAWLGSSGALAANAGSFLISAALLAGVPALAERLTPTDGGVLAATRQGLTFAWRDPVVRAVVIILFFGCALAAMDNVALVFLVRDELGAGAAGFGLASSAWGAGMLVGSLLLLRAARGTDPARLWIGALVVTGVAVGFTALAPSLAAVVALMLIGGAGNGVDNVANSTLIQQRVPQEMLGRVFGTASTAAFAGAGVASALGGVLLDLTSARMVFAVAGGGLLVICALAARLVFRAEPV